MDFLNQQLATSPYLRCISLDHRGIEDIAPYLSALGKFSSLEDLELSENKLTALPANLSSLKKVKELNLSGNQFLSLEKTVEALKTLPCLRRLSLNLDSPEEVELVLSSLPYLEMLNDQEVKNEGQEEKKREQASNDLVIEHAGPPTSSLHGKIQNSLQRSDIEEAKKWHAEAIKALHGEEGKLGKIDDFDEKATAIDKNVRGSIKSASFNGIKRAVYLIGKEELLTLCFDDIIEGIKNEDVKKILAYIRKSHQDCTRELYSLVINEEPEKKTEALKVQIEEMQKEIDILSESNKEKEEIINKSLKEKEDIQIHHKKEIEELYAEIEALRLDNKKYLDMSAAPMPIEKSPKKEIAQLSPSKKSVASPSPAKDNKLLKKSSQEFPLQPKSLTLKQLKEVIQDVSVQKIKYDAKCKENKLPRETMEQYMYTYLNQHYGLKSLILEWATSILNGVNVYSASDTEVGVFGKILKNECDEEFRFILPKLQEKINETLKDLLKKRYKHKDEGHIGEMFSGFVEGTANLDAPLWQETIEKLYNPEEAGIIINRIKEIIKDKSLNNFLAKVKRTSMGSKSPAKGDNSYFGYSEFIKVILDFHLARHDKYLKPFLEAFKQIDTDTNGLVNEEEFKSLLAKVHPTHKESDFTKLLEEIDPWNHQQITFSECVMIFSTEKVAGNLTVLDQLQKSK